MTTKDEAYELADVLETVSSDFAEDHDAAVEGAGLIRALVDERDRLIREIDTAPHADSFCTAGQPYGQEECVCWKARALEGSE